MQPGPPRLPDRDTVNDIYLAPSDYAADSAAYFYILEFSHVDIFNIGGGKHDTTYARYRQGDNGMHLHFVGPGGVLLSASGITSLNSFGVTYRLDKQLLGRPLFETYTFYNNDTVKHAIYYASPDSVTVYVGVNSYPPAASLDVITERFNALLDSRLDTTGFSRY